MLNHGRNMDETSGASEVHPLRSTLNSLVASADDFQGCDDTVALTFMAARKHISYPSALHLDSPLAHANQHHVHPHKHGHCRRHYPQPPSTPSSPFHGQPGDSLHLVDELDLIKSAYKNGIIGTSPSFIEITSRAGHGGRQRLPKRPFTIKDPECDSPVMRKAHRRPLVGSYEV